MKLILHFILVLLLAAQSKSETVEKEDAQVKWTDIAGSSSNQDSHPFLPDKVVLNLTIGNEAVELNLIKKKNDDFEDVPVILGNNEKVKAWHHSGDEEFSVYSDNSKDASFTVAVKAENGVLMKEYHGSFVHDGVKYTLTPAKLHEETNDPTDVIHTFSLDRTQYVVYKDSEQQTGKGDVTHIEDFIKPDLKETAKSPEKVKVTNISEATDSEVPMAIANQNPEKESNLADSDTRRERSLRRKRSSDTKLIVDLMVIVDNSMYMRWLKINDNDKKQTIDRIRYFLAFVVNGVNNIYTSMTSYWLTFKVVEIFIAETSSESLYLEDSKAKPFADKRKINFTASLDGFAHWVNKSTPSKGEALSETKFLKHHDIAIAFTDYNNKPVEGLAYLGTVCGNLSQGLVHAVDQYSTISTTAHEIGHVLGSAHDGDKNKCNPSDQFLMTDLYTNEKLGNRDKMSSCSSDQIKTKIEELIRNEQNCMDPSTKLQRKRIDLDKYRTSHPGVHFGPDMQCQLKFGDGYKFCSNGTDTGLNMCSQMKCLNTQDMKCYNSKDFAVAIDGTSCGREKWCMKGECLPGAPVKPEDKDKKDTCYFGDKSDKFTINYKTMQCKDFLKNPEFCYYYGDWCCETCEKIKRDLNLENCPYGDKGIRIKMDGKIHNCSLVLELKYLCLEKTYIEDCCESCIKANNKPEITESPGSTEEKPSDTCNDDGKFSYGSQVITCDYPLQNPSSCYDLDKDCCKACTDLKNKKKSSVANCFYGDRHMELSDGIKVYGCELVRERTDLCNQADIEKGCCESCDKVKKAQKTPEISTGVTQNTCNDDGKFSYGSQVITCDYPLQNPSSCYDLDKDCCKACTDLKNKKKSSVANCFYGDRHMELSDGIKVYGCELVRERTDLCNQADIEKGCCESCDKVKKAQKTPEISTGVTQNTCNDDGKFSYGSQVITCDYPLQNPSSCYDLDKDCCKACTDLKNKKKSSVANCFYGDRHMELSDGIKVYGCELVRERTDLCNQADIEKGCCESCDKVKKAQKTPEISTGVTQNTCNDDGRFRYGSQVITCDYPLQNPSSCYDLDEHCCKACTDLKNKKKSSVANCSYGDRHMKLRDGIKVYGCELVRERTDLCNQTDIEKGCCESCDKVKKAQKTPEISTGVTQSTCKNEKGKFDYAGKKINCKYLLTNANLCSQFDKRCCKTCADIKKKNAKCKNEKGKFDYAGKWINCKYLLGNASLCYEYEKRCCKTCADIKQKKALPYDNCAYGDRYTVIYEMFGKKYGCESLLLKPGGCLSHDIERCCETCGKAKKNVLTATTTKKIEGTIMNSCVDRNEYQGNIIDCKSLLQSPGKCYWLKHYCCQTCSDIERSKAAQLGSKCPYGDLPGIKLSIQNIKYDCWIVLWKQYACLDSYAKQYCCESCSRVNLGQRPIVPEFK